jgi:hypothetical protein
MGLRPIEPNNVILSSDGKNGIVAPNVETAAKCLAESGVTVDSAKLKPYGQDRAENLVPATVPQLEETRKCITR